MTNDVALHLTQPKQQPTRSEALHVEGSFTADRPIHYARFLLLLLAVPLFAIPLSILLGKSDYFIHHGASVWVQSNDAAFDLRDRDCKVLVFGDSTAMTGIDPAMVQERTGRKTCNISVTNAVLSVTHRLTLDNYLAHNARPEVILVQLSPEGFQTDSQQWNSTIYAEGILEMLRHAPVAQSRAVLWHHPQEALTFSGYAAGFSAWYLVRQALYYTTHIILQEDVVRISNGFFTPPAQARTYCEPMERSPQISQGASARKVVEEYQNYADLSTVLVDVSPIPACDRDLNTYRNELLGVTSNTLISLPIRYFNDRRHFTAPGSRVLSSIVSEQVNTATAHHVEDRALHLTSIRMDRHSALTGRVATISVQQ